MGIIFWVRKAKSSLYSSKGLPTTLPPELIISKDVCVFVFIYLEKHLFNSSIPNLDLEISFYLISMVSTFVKSFPKVSATNHSNIWALQHLIFTYTMGLITFHHICLSVCSVSPGAIWGSWQQGPCCWIAPDTLHNHHLTCVRKNSIHNF